MAFGPSATLFRHFIAEAEIQVGSIYGRKIYEIMRYWDDDHPEWGEPEHAFAAAWRKQTKWVVSRKLKTVGPNASLVAGDLGTASRSGFRRASRPPLRVKIVRLRIVPRALQANLATGAVFRHEVYAVATTGRQVGAPVLSGGLHEIRRALWCERRGRLLPRQAAPPAPGDIEPGTRFQPSSSDDSHLPIARHQPGRSRRSRPTQHWQTADAKK